MQRKEILLKAFQRKKELTITNESYKRWIERFIIDEIKTDIGKNGDLTTKAVLRGNTLVKAHVVSREPGLVAGIEESCHLYHKNKIQIKRFKKDGDEMKAGDLLLELKGSLENMLRVERSAVDILQRMSGIATLTHNVIASIDARIPIAPTRKTQWRFLDKKAVAVGGGLTHRLALWDAILIKDNHLKALQKMNTPHPIQYALEQAWKKRKYARFVEIEVTTQKDAIYAAEILSKLKGDTPRIIMLDNLPPKKIKKILKELTKKKLRSHVLIEASGGITPQNIKAYASCSVDVISMGFLTHSARALDIKQRIL